MPLTYLIDHFNDRIRSGDLRFLPENPIAVHDGRVIARFATLQLTSAFQPVVSPLQGGYVIGHEALLRAYLGDGRPLAPHAVFSVPTSSRAVVYLDRLCRTVHMLNYLRQTDADTGCLFLNVSMRHLLSVLRNHGWYFEEVLHRCGLTPDHIVIEVHASAIEGDHAARVTEAIANYRARGYRVAIEDFVPHHDSVDRLWRLFPDIVKIDCRYLIKPGCGLPQWVELFRYAGSEVIVTGVETEKQARIARAVGVDGLQGRYFGDAKANAATLTVQHRLGRAGEDTSELGGMRLMTRLAARLQYCW